MYQIRDISSFMKERNIVGNSKGYIERIVSSYKSVKIEAIRKYFMSSVKYMNLL